MEKKNLSFIKKNQARVYITKQTWLMERCSFQNSGPCFGELMSLVSLSDGEKDVRGHF